MYFIDISQDDISYQDYQRTKEEASLLPNPFLQHEYTSSESSASLRISEDGLYFSVGAINRVTGVCTEEN